LRLRRRQLCTTSFACASWRLISLIEADSSSAATAAVSTLADASLDPRTAPSARCSVWSDVVSNVLAAVFIAAALCPTVISMFSTRARKEAMAASVAARRSSR
jgi:hypothetical protein